MSTTSVKCADLKVLLTTPPLMSGTSREEFQQIFEAVASVWGQKDAESYCQQMSKAFNMGVMLGPLPPSDSRLNSVDIGEFTVFYHPTWPSAPKGQYFTWNFYIGLAGKGRESIILDWAKQGIVVKVEVLTDRWENLRFPTVGAGTRVRVSYLNALGASITHELVFPRPPQESSIPVHHLHWLQ